MKTKIPANPNVLCKNCFRNCKQADHVHLISCPRYDPRPVQLELKLYLPKRKPKNPPPY